MGGLDYLVRCLPSRPNHLRNIVEYKQIGLVCAILREKTVHLSFESMSGPYFEHFTK